MSKKFLRQNNFFFLSTFKILFYWKKMSFTFSVFHFKKENFWAEGWLLRMQSCNQIFFQFKLLLILFCLCQKYFITGTSQQQFNFTNFKIIHGCNLLSLSNINHKTCSQHSQVVKKYSRWRMFMYHKCHQNKNEKNVYGGLLEWNITNANIHFKDSYPSTEPGLNINSVWILINHFFACSQRRIKEHYWHYTYFNVPPIKRYRFS